MGFTFTEQSFLSASANMKYSERHAVHRSPEFIQILCQHCESVNCSNVDYDLFYGIWLWAIFMTYWQNCCSYIHTVHLYYIMKHRVYGRWTTLNRNTPRRWWKMLSSQSGRRFNPWRTSTTSNVERRLSWTPSTQTCLSKLIKLCFTEL